MIRRRRWRVSPTEFEISVRAGPVTLSQVSVKPMTTDRPISSQLNVLGNSKSRVDLLATLLRQLSNMGWDTSDSFSIQLAVEEAVANAYQHGNREGQHGNVDVRWSISDTEFVMEVRDQGDGFNVEDVPDPTADENLEKPSGRGVLLIQSYMSAVEYQDGGRLVIMRKSKSTSVTS